MKNYRKILKARPHIEKPAYESVPILKPVNSSSLYKTVKKLKIWDNQFNTIQENPIDSIRKLKLSNPHKILPGNVNSLWNILYYYIFLLLETKIDKSLPDKQFRLNNFRIFQKRETGMGEGSCFMWTRISCAKA